MGAVIEQKKSYSYTKEFYEVSEEEQFIKDKAKKYDISEAAAKDIAEGYYQLKNRDR